MERSLLVESRKLKSDFFRQSCSASVVGCSWDFPLIHSCIHVKQMGDVVTHQFVLATELFVLVPKLFCYLAAVFVDTLNVFVGTLNDLVCVIRHDSWSRLCYDFVHGITTSFGTVWLNSRQLEISRSNLWLNEDWRC